MVGLRGKCKSVVTCCWRDRNAPTGWKGLGATAPARVKCCFLCMQHPASKIRVLKE